MPPHLSSPNVLLNQSTNSVDENYHYFTIYCCRTKVGIISVTAFAIFNIILLLPLYVSVLYLGFQQWKQKGSRLTVTHSDFFTYHMVMIELISVLGSTLCCCAVHINNVRMLLAGINLLTINLFGQTSFHILTCVERYLAVVHPIIYMKLKKAKGIRIRNITAGCVWLLSFMACGVWGMMDDIFIVVSSSLSAALFIFGTSFCSLSVLCVLTRPGPGKVDVSRQQIDHSKLKAFYTIIIIQGVVLFRFLENWICNAMYPSKLLNTSEKCGLLMSGIWFTLPSCLVLPILFLQRTGKHMS